MHDSSRIYLFFFLVLDVFRIGNLLQVSQCSEGQNYLIFHCGSHQILCSAKVSTLLELFFFFSFFSYFATIPFNIFSWNLVTYSREVILMPLNKVQHNLGPSEVRENFWF